MRHRILAAVLALTSACATTTARPTTPAPKPVAAAPAPKVETPFIVLGEAIAYDGTEPVTRLHADGTSEVFKDQTWTAGQRIEPDGDVMHEGRWIGSLTREHLRVLRIEVSGTEIRGWTPDGDLRLVLSPDGSYSATLANRATSNRYRILGTNPEVRRTLFMLLSVIAIVNYRIEAKAKQSA
jgi:hypothetical protein